MEKAGLILLGVVECLLITPMVFVHGLINISEGLSHHHVIRLQDSAEKKPVEQS